MKFVLIAMIVLSAALLMSGCGSGGKEGKNSKPVDMPISSDNLYQVQWREINPPPNSTGPCYAYFYRESLSLYETFGYSGVYCTPQQ